ncbi:HD domain-containing protein [Polaromonas sp. P1(28)-13]|nr:HD domain-containing protein [Polaromonas sp. P1(28)-13]
MALSLNPQLQHAIMFANGSFCAVGQVRKYTGEPYIHHPIRVMAFIDQANVVTDTMRKAAILHDCMEDTAVTYEDIERNFGKGVADLVDQLTDIARLEDGVRAVRCNINRAHTAKATPEAKTIKLADVIDNCENIVELAPSFATTYLEEKRLLLEVLTEGDARLYRHAHSIVHDGILKLKETK